MPIRTLPLGDITAATVRELIAREIREDRTLDFKQELAFTDSGKLDFLCDVAAMANADGGTILYGAVEGEEGNRGRIVEVRPMHLVPDATTLTINNLLRDNIDERIPGVEHRAIPFGEDTYLYVVRTPASPRAPHMITRPSQRPRFYLRGTASNDPMNLQQIRESVLRSSVAYDRAKARIEARVAAVNATAQQRANRAFQVRHDRAASADFVVLHVLPLFPPAGGIDLSPRDLFARWNQVLPFGHNAVRQVSLGFEGMRAEWDRGDGVDAWTMLLRDGGLEFVQIDIGQVDPHRVPPRRIDGLTLEMDVLSALARARALADEGHISLPAVLSLQLHHMDGMSAFALHTRLMAPTIVVDNVPIAPVEIHRWEDADDAARALFHIMWQSWGYQRSPYYDDNGVRRVLR